MKKILCLLLLCAAAAACDRLYDTPTDDGRLNAGVGDKEAQLYVDQYDRIADKGQFWHPDALGGMPASPVSTYGLFNLSSPLRNDPDVPGGGATDASGDGLQYHLLSQSFAALCNKALAAGKVTTAAWMDAADGVDAYKECSRFLGISPTWIVHTGNPMTNPGFAPLDGGVMDVLGTDYVLTDLRNNPESGVVAIVASHVYGAFIVDKRDQAFYDGKGFRMVYDASQKTTADSWREFRDACDNRALVVMPVHTGELADFAIANKLFVVNLNKKYNTPSGGQNTELFREILAWLAPNSPVYGWEPGVGEDEFVIPVSRSGNMMVALGEFNTPFFSKDYRSRQHQNLAKVLNPQDIDFAGGADKRFVAYYLSDGPHAGWMMNGFVENYYSDPKVAEVHMNFGITASNISQIAPLQFDKIIAQQHEGSTLIESFGGGYWYSDDFGAAGDRASLLRGLAEKVAAHMRQHRIKILEQIAHDPLSPAAMETYQAFVDANDQLEGIVAIQYAPSYAGGGGEILWVTNRQGYDIPVVTVRYSIWNFGDTNHEHDGSPTYVAHKLNAQPADAKFSAVIVHAWSAFTDTGESDDELAENAPGGTLRGASAAEMCNRRLDAGYEDVSMQELIWRIRMEYRPEQTRQYLNQYF